VSDYKVLSESQTSHHGGTGKWVKGRARNVKGELMPCRNGLHYCTRDQLVGWLGPQIWLFEDLSPDETVDGGDKMVTRKGRVVERLETWNDMTARLFAADCAEQALRFIPESHREPFAAAISVARGFARGEISDSERAAAWDAARDAARAAAGDAAWAAAWAAAWDAAWAAAWDAAWAAAWDAARAAAWAAAGDAARAAAWAWQTDRLFDYLEGRAA